MFQKAEMQRLIRVYANTKLVLTKSLSLTKNLYTHLDILKRSLYLIVKSLKRFCFYKIFFFLTVSIHPANITKLLSTPRTIIIEWDNPPTDKYRGALTKHEVCYNSDFSSRGCNETNWNVTRYVFTNLIPYIMYEINIRSAGIVGYSPFSTGKYIRTLQAGKEKTTERLKTNHMYVEFLT